MRMPRLQYLMVATTLLAVAVRASADDVHTVRTLAGYQCMVLAKQWDGQGAMPPPVHVYTGPEMKAATVGVAGGSIIVPQPLHPVDGRSQMIFADGRMVWISIDAISPWHAASNAHATCSPVLLSNGRYGFHITH